VYGTTVHIFLPSDNLYRYVEGFQGVDSVTMIAVGVGLAPMVQALHAMLANPKDTTKVVFLYGSRSVRDVLMRETLDAWAQAHPDKFKVVYYVGSRWRVEDIIMHLSDCPKTCGKPCSRRKIPEPEGYETLKEGCKGIGGACTG
jgi:ferredoxin-NADP reductase